MAQPSRHLEEQEIHRKIDPWQRPPMEHVWRILSDIGHQEHLQLVPSGKARMTNGYQHQLGRCPYVLVWSDIDPSHLSRTVFGMGDATIR
jgi:hypothetical protein